MTRRPSIATRQKYQAKLWQAHCLPPLASSKVLTAGPMSVPGIIQGHCRRPRIADAIVNVISNWDYIKQRGIIDTHRLTLEVGKRISPPPSARTVYAICRELGREGVIIRNREDGDDVGYYMPDGAPLGPFDLRPDED